jgi:hypothetical protein
MNLYKKRDYYTDYLNAQGISLSEHLELSKIKLNLSFEPFKQFAQTHEPLINYLIPKPYFSVESGGLQQSVFNFDLGYNQYNATENNYGFSEEENKQLKVLLGKENFNKLDLDEDSTLIRLLVYYPGNGIPLHTDTFNSYRSFYNMKSDAAIDIKRYFVAINPWDWGQFLQIHDNMIHHWAVGDCYQIPEGAYHLSANFGISPKYSLTITGVPK